MLISLLDIIAMPADSAFVAGKLELPLSPSGATAALEPSWSANTLALVLGFISLILIMFFIQRMINILPSLMGCIFRAKECTNLEDSAKLSRDRDLCAALLFIPAAIVCSLWQLWNPSFMGGMRPGIHLLIVLGVLLVYCGLRLLGQFLVRGSMRRKVFQTGTKAFRTFFITATLLALILAGLLPLFGVDHSIVRKVILWETAAIYAIFLIRKIQIFGPESTLFSSFLYLCALELVPTGILVLTAVLI